MARDGDGPFREPGGLTLAILDAVAAQIAVLDGDGVIVAVNQSWRRFAVETAVEPGRTVANTDIGTNYLEVCGASALSAADDDANNARAGILAVLAGESASFTHEYPCHSPTRQRWFSMTATPLGGGRAGVVLAHNDITEGKLGELAVRDSEARYRALLDWLPEPVRIHRGGVVLYVNPAAVRLFGADSARDLVGRSVLDRIHPDSRDTALARLSATIDHDFNAPKAELRFTRMDGRPIDVEVQGTSVIFDGAPAVYAALHDITERKRNDAALLGTARRFRTILSNLHGGILLIDNHARVEFANREFCDMFGLDDTPEGLVGLPAAAVLQTISAAYRYPPAALARVQELVSSGHEILDEEVQLRGQRTYLRDFVPIEVDGRPHGRLWYYRNVTEQQRGRDALRESEVRYRTLIDWVPEPITVHRDMTFVYVNPAAVRLFGAARADDLVGRSLLDFVAPEWHEAARARAAAVRRDGACPLSELGNRRLDGTPIEVEVQSIAIEYDGAPAVLGVVRDISARKAALRALRQSEARLLGVVQSAMDAIVTVDEGLNVVLYNDAAAAMFGAPAAEVVGTSLNRFIPTRFRVGHGGLVASFGREGRTSRAMGRPGQIMALRSGGEEFPVEASISHVDVEGRKLYTVIMRDVSRKVAAERELRLLGAVVAASPQAILIADARADDLPVVFVNPAFEATTGYAPADVIGRNCRFLQGAETGQPGLAALRAALAAGTNCQVLLRNYRKDGSMFWNQLSVAPLRDADGVLTHFIAMQDDVSAHESAVAALAESEARFRMLAEQAPVMIGMRGTDRRYVYLNQEMRAFTGYTAEALAAMAWDEGVHAEDRERIRAVFNQAFDTLTPYAFDYRRRRCDGEYRWLRAYAVPRYDPSGAFVGYIGTLVDITDAVEAEAVLRESAALLEGRVAERTAELSATIAELETMTMAVSHDLRAPLHRMAGFAGLLLTDDEVRRSPTAMDFADRIVRSAERMEELITSLLESARLGRAAVQPAMVPFGDLVRSYAAEIKERHTGSRIEWRIEALPLVYCDAVMARQVVQNLLENAVKYSAKREQPRIEVLPIDNPDEHGFLVRDNGVGFSMDQADQLFGVFRRLHSESEFPGVGIGLANVHRIMQKHGGRIWCDAAPGQGATFFVAFPKSGGKTESESKVR